MIEKIAGDVLNLWWDYQERNCPFLFPHINRSLPAIAQSHSVTILPMLLERLRDSDYEVRSRAAEVLEQMGAAAAKEEVLAALVVAVYDAEYWVRRNAAAALGQMMAQGMLVFQKQEGYWEGKTVVELSQ